jgi:hypothetical protein
MIVFEFPDNRPQIANYEDLNSRGSMLIPYYKSEAKLKLVY